MPTDIIVYSFICLFAASFVKRISEVFASYDTQSVDPTMNPETR